MAQEIAEKLVHAAESISLSDTPTETRLIPVPSGSANSIVKNQASYVEKMRDLFESNAVSEDLLIRYIESPQSLSSLSFSCNDDSSIVVKCVSLFW